MMQFVAGSAVGDDVSFTNQAGGSHPQRLEDFVVQVGPERLAGDPAGDQGQQRTEAGHRTPGRDHGNQSRSTDGPHGLGQRRGGAGEPVTDRGDASGTGYFATAKGAWLPEVAAAALGHEPALPRVAAPGEAIGQTPGGALLGPGTGDNMAAALGLGLEPGEVAVSIGTSGTAFAVTEVPADDPTGTIAGFADATGRFLPLTLTVNAGLVLSATARLTGTDLDGMSALALAAESGAGGITQIGRAHV